MATSSHPSRGALTITTPTDALIVYDMAVRLQQAELLTVCELVTLEPWVRVTADEDTARVAVAAGIRVRRA
jgi:hypothetical protein